MIYLLYLFIAALVVLLSNKASEYVDLLDKKTNLSGAFIGGVMLSAVTSLPELFTSISATLMLNKPGLCIGNILGSDLFNIAFLSIMFILAIRSFQSVKVAKSHMIVAFSVFVVYIFLFLNMYHVINYDLFTVNVTSLIIILLYIFAVRNMAGEDGTQSESDETDSPLTVKQIACRFVLVSIGIVALSIAITYVTDIIAVKLNLGAGLAGALFLGIATSLPEVSSTIALFRMKNYNIAIGNMIGSNLFNLFILSFADILYIGNGIYDFSDPKTINLLVYGLIATAFMFIIFKWQNKMGRVVCSLGVIACYVLFLVI